MLILLTLVHVIVCVFLVIVVLLQSGKAADLAGAFGGMGSQTAFGPRGSATLLSKATTVAAGLFMVTSLTLAIVATRGAGGSSSVVERSTGKSAAKPQQQATKPATPGTQAAPGVQVNPGAAGQPSVTVRPLGVGGEKGASQTQPLPLDQLPRVDPSKVQQPKPDQKK